MFNKIVPLLLLCTYFGIIKTEEINTIYIEIRKSDTCLTASTHNLTGGTECIIEVLTPYFLESSSFRINESQLLVNSSNQIIVFNNITNSNSNLNLLAVYTYKIDVLQNLSGQWTFVFTFFQESNMNACKTNVSINMRMEVPPAAITELRSFADYKSEFCIVVVLFGIILSCQTIYIVYVKYQLSRSRDISKRPQQPLPLEVYDIVAPEPTFTNEVFDMSDERPSRPPPIVAKKPPRVLPPHPGRFGHEILKKADKTTPRLNVVGKPSTVLPPHPGRFGHEILKKADKTTPRLNVVCKPSTAIPLKSFGEPNNVADKRMIPIVARNQSKGNRLTWEEDWEYEPLAPTHKYL